MEDHHSPAAKPCHHRREVIVVTIYNHCNQLNTAPAVGAMQDLVFPRAGRTMQHN